MSSTFVFYSNSRHSRPGKGRRETLCVTDDFSDLHNVPHWRRMLSNFLVCDNLDIDGLRWATVEHYYQACKFKNTNPDKFRSLSLTYNPQATNPCDAKRIGSKRATRGRIDNDFFDGSSPRASKEMWKAQCAKFSQNPDLLRVLKLTRTATLLHYVRGKPQLFVSKHLMKIRNEM